MALKDLSRECKTHIAPMAPSILTTICKTLPNIPPGRSEALRLLYAAGKLLNSLPTTEDQIVYLEATLGLSIMRLTELLQQSGKEAETNIANHLTMISTFLSTLEGSIGETVLEALFPIFEGVIFLFLLYIMMLIII